MRLTDENIPNIVRVEIYHKYKLTFLLKNSRPVEHQKQSVTTVSNWEQHALTIGFQLTNDSFVSYWDSHTSSLSTDCPVLLGQGVRVYRHSFAVKAPDIFRIAQFLVGEDTVVTK